MRKSAAHSSSFSYNAFMPMNKFISTTSGIRNLTKLYKYKLLPSQYLSTPKNIIKKLTEKVYIPLKNTEFPLVLPYPDSKTNEGKGKKQKQKSRLKISVNKLSFNKLNKTCENFLKKNKSSQKVLKKNNRILRKKIHETKKMIENVESSNNRAGYYVFHRKLNEGHEALMKMKILNNKSHENFKQNLYSI